MITDPNQTTLPQFNGSNYEPARDGLRLSNQHRRLWALMRDQQWRTLDQIATATGDPPASVSAQLRHMRKPRFGAHTVNRKYAGEGLFFYQVVPASTP